MAARRTIPALRPSPALQALLGLSGMLARAKQGGVFSEALALVFEGTGAQRGIVYEAHDDGLELVAEEGLPATLRAFIRAFPSAEAPWFPVQIAAKKRRLTVELDVASAVSARIDAALINSSGFSAMAAAPILLGRDVLGVLALAAPSSEAFSPDAIAVLESAANMLALSIARDRALAQDKPTATRDDRRSSTETKLARLAILGSLAAGFADELRWPLSSLGSQLSEQEKLIEELRQRYPAAYGAFDDLSRIQDEATAALRFARTAGLRLLSAIEDSPAEPIDVADLAHEAAALVEPTARAKSVDILVSSLHEADPIVIGKHGDLGQLLLALLTNAVEACAAMPRTPGKDGEEPEKPLVCLTVMREAAKNKVVVRVEDSGPGLAPDVRPRIFEPFFSTKKEGAGLGLTLARQVALAHDGTIELDRSDLGGALVRVVLPAAPRGTQVTRMSPAPASRRKPLSVPAPEDSAPHTARDGWTSAPTALRSPSKRPVRAPQVAPGSLRIGGESASDACAPTQRVPRTPAVGAPAVPAAAAATPMAATIPNPISTPTPTPKTAAFVEPGVTPSVDVVVIAPSAAEGNSSGKVAPTARVPEAPRRAPKSRRGK
jgi:signal transduction histidine kinase